MNKLFITGNLTRDPRLRYLDDGKAVCDFTVAVNQPVSRANRDAEMTDYFDVTVWRKLAENCAKYLSKGRKVTVVGPVHQEQYTARDGTLRSIMRVTATDVEFLFGTPATPDAEPADGFTPVDDADLPF